MTQISFMIETGSEGDENRKMPLLGQENFPLITWKM
jgi:hypothetical protein